MPNLFKKLRSSTRYPRSSNVKIAATSDLTSGQSIDNLIEDTETVIEMGIPQTTAAMALIEQDLESRSLPPTEMLRFSGNPSQ